MASYDFSNVNVAGIISAITSLKENLNFETLTNASESLSGDAYWVSDLSKTCFLNGLNTNMSLLTHIKESLDKAIGVCNEIAAWQDLNNTMNTEITNAAYYQRQSFQYIDKLTAEITDNNEYSRYNYLYNTSAQKIKECQEGMRQIEQKLKPSLPFIIVGAVG